MAALSNEDQIRALMNEWAEAVRERDVDKLIAHYASDVVVCDLMPPLHYVGVERYRKYCEGWFAHWKGPINCERHELNVTASDDVAFASCLTHNTGTSGDGSHLDFWVRVTVGFRKIDGAWKVVHEHVSVPIDMETTQGCFDLKPE